MTTLCRRQAAVPERPATVWNNSRMQNPGRSGAPGRCGKKGESNLKKFSAVLLVLTLLCSCVFGAQAETDTLSVGTLTKMNGYFFTDLWGNNATDLEVQNLIHGLSTIAWVSESEYIPDPTVVKELLLQDNPDGSRTFYVFLNEGLCYSDGSEITAVDYVFTILLLASPQLKALGGAETAYSFLQGYDAYHSGETEYFSGVRLMSSYIFSLTVDAAHLPFYYENSYADVTPYPIQVLLGDYQVADSESGAYLTTDNDALPLPFAAETLRERLFGKNGYMTAPSVVSGPYCLERFDFESSTAVLNANPNYPGNAYGQKPLIESIVISECGVDEALEGLENGGFDLVTQCVSGSMIEAGLSAGFNCELYPRRGLAYVCFACEGSILSDAAVRKAIACMTDREGLVDSYLGSYGVTVYGYYGVGQWMAQTALGSFSLNGTQAVSLQDFNTTPFDIQAAEQLLNEAGWNKSAEGGAYTDGVRYNGKGEPLSLTLAIPEGGAGGAAYADFVKDTYASAGAELVIDVIPFDELLTDLYSAGERSYDMYFLGSNFSKLFDPGTVFRADEKNVSVSNLTRVNDERLFEKARAMNLVKSGNTVGYYEAWRDFQICFGEVMPLLPLYSNLYADFYGSRLTDYSLVGCRDWTEAILSASIR